MACKIPIFAPDLNSNEEKYVVDAIRSSWASSCGQYLKKLEEESARELGGRRVQWPLLDKAHNT